MRRSPLDAWLAGRMGLAGAAGKNPDGPVPVGPDPAALEAWQMAELRRTLAWARQASPFHAQRLAGLDVDTLTGPTDMARLPRMTAADLAAPGLLSVSQDEVERVVTLPSSGTSGPPKRLHFSAADLERTLDFFAVGMRTLCAPGDVVLVLLPGRRQWGVADLLARALPRLSPAGGARAVAAPEDWSPESLPGLLRAEGATVLVAAPVQLRRLLALPPSELAPVRAVLSSAEPLPPELRAALEQAWGCTVLDHWGMTETGYGGGVECAARSGYHLREADLLVEVADCESGQPLPPGQAGEILVTTLGPRAMPLVRYRTGDAAAFLPGPCPCGSALRRLGRVPGRIGPGGLGPDGQGIVNTPKGGRSL